MDVYVGRADGSGVPERLTESANLLVPMSWSSDGMLLTLVELVLGGDLLNLDLWVLPLEGDGEPQAFLTTECSGNPSGLLSERPLDRLLVRRIGRLRGIRSALPGEARQVAPLVRRWQPAQMVA